MIPVMTRKDFSSGNPGDVFILWGFQYLMEKAFGKKLDWLLLNKFSKQDFAKHKNLLESAGWMIYAGTPQYNNYDDWCLWYDWPVWQEYLIPLEIDFYAIAGGAGFPDLNMTPDQFAEYCLQSQKTKSILNSRYIRSSLITVRDPHAHELLNKLDQKNHLLPCTAWWAGNYIGAQSKKIPGSVILVPPNPTSVSPLTIDCQNINEVEKYISREFGRLYKELESLGFKPIIVCHNIREYQLFKTEYKTLWTNDALQLLRYYGTAQTVISARLHGCLPAHGMGSKVVGISIDTRTSACTVVAIPYIKLNELSTTSGQELLNKAVMFNSNFMNQQSAKYIALFIEHFTKYIRS